MFLDPGIQYPWLSPKSLRAWNFFDLTTTFSNLLTMSHTANDPDYDSGILQMGLVVSDAEAEGNEHLNEAVESDHDGSDLPDLIDPSSNESTPQRNAVADVLMGLNDPVPFTFGSNLPQSSANHGRINHLEHRPAVARRPLQSTIVPFNRQNMDNTTPTGSREIHYCMLHILALMANLSSQLLRLDDVVSAHSDGNLLTEEHVFTSSWFQEVNHLSGIILMNINNTKNIISNSNTWEDIYNKLIREFLRITPHAEEYLNLEQLTEYMEISDPH